MAILTENRMRESGLALLTLEELAIISSRDPEGLSAREIEFVLRSQLLRSGDRHRHHIIRWTKEFKRACDREIQHQS
jgi:hypothetical protein